MSETYTVVECARRMGIDHQTLRNLIKTKQVPFGFRRRFLSGAGNPTGEYGTNRAESIAWLVLFVRRGNSCSAMGQFQLLHRAEEQNCRRDIDVCIAGLSENDDLAGCDCADKRLDCRTVPTAFGNQSDGTAAGVEAGNRCRSILEDFRYRTGWMDTGYLPNHLAHGIVKRPCVRTGYRFGDANSTGNRLRIVRCKTTKKRARGACHGEYK